MAAKKLAKNVWVDGTLYLAGDSPEKAVADQISNPNAWDDKSEGAEVPESAEVVVGEVTEEATPAPAKKTASKKS